MKKLLTTIALSLTAVMATTAAMAGPGPDHRFDPRKAPPSHMAKHTPQFKHAPKHANRYHDDRRFNDRQHFNKERLRVGQTLPRAFDSKRFEVNARDARGLAKPTRNQQWYKVNGDYVLVNERNNRILRVL